MLGAEGFGGSIGKLRSAVVAEEMPLAIEMHSRYPLPYPQIPMHAPIARRVVSVNPTILLVIQITALSDAQVLVSTVEPVAVFVLTLAGVTMLKAEELTMQEDLASIPLAISPEILGSPGVAIGTEMPAIASDLPIPKIAHNCVGTHTAVLCVKRNNLHERRGHPSCDGNQGIEVASCPPGRPPPVRPGELLSNHSSTATVA